MTGDNQVVFSDVGNFDRYVPFSIACRVKAAEEFDRAVIFHRSRAWTDAASRGYEMLIIDGYLQASLIHFWPGNAISVRSSEKLSVDQWQHITMTYDGSSCAEGIEIWIEGRRQPVTIVRDNLYKTTLGGGQDEIAIGARFRDRGFKDSLVADFYVYDRELRQAEVEDLLNRDSSSRRSSPGGFSLSELLNAETLTESQTTRLRDYYFHTVDEAVSKSRAELQNARQEWCQYVDKLSEIMVMREFDSPRETFVLDRGAYDQPRKDEPVTAGTPVFLPPMNDDTPKNRLGLAQWLTRPDHPLTSRVAVNRFWQICFGNGLVNTPEDFGRQGAAPTHPELLDWLACDFAGNGWDTKRLLKQLVMSQTYCQSSRVSRELLEFDPENRMLARGPSFHLPAEMLRDNALAVSGLLVEKTGGAPVKPFDLEQSFKPVAPDKGDALFRRSLYTYWNRTGPSPLLISFDAAKRDVCTVKRERTSTPLQSLALLNSPHFVESSRALAAMLMKKYASEDPAEIDSAEIDDQKVSEGKNAIASEMFRLLTGRKIEDPELQVILNLYEKQLVLFDADDLAVQSFLGEYAVKDASLDPYSMAAWANVALTLFSFDESVMRK